jgi:hypothetical protein
MPWGVLAMHKKWIIRERAHQKRIDSLRDLVLWPGDRHQVACHFSAWEIDLAVPLLLQVLDLGHAGKEFAVIKTVDGHGFGNEFGILVVLLAGILLILASHDTHHFLDHVHDLLLDQVQVLGIASWGATNDIVDFDVVLVFADATTVHSVGKLDEHGVFLHDTLDVLASDSDDPLVVLVGNVEGD